MEITLETMVDLRQVEQLKYDYCWAYDSGDLDALVALFTDDAVCELGGFGTWRGVEEIRSGYGELMAATGISGSRRHVAAQPAIDIDGDSAVARWCVLDFRTEAGVPQPVRIVGIANDVCRRVGGVWRISRTGLDVQWIEP